MIYLIHFLVFLFGLVVGSFLNCLIYRLEKGEGFLIGRSFCPHCRHVLAWQDLIPIFSFLILKGKCRYCRKKIPLQYPLVELSTAILFSSIWQTAVSSIEEFLFLALVSCFLIIIFVYDLKHYIIPDKIIYPAIGTAFIYQLFRIWTPTLPPPSQSLPGPHLEFVSNLQPLLNPLVSAILASTFFLAIVLVSHGKWMGVGDIKLAFLMGLFLGFPNILVALFLAFLIGAITGLGLIILGKKTLKSEVPFGPFLVSGTFLAIFFGQKILDWYLNLFLLK